MFASSCRILATLGLLLTAGANLAPSAATLRHNHLVKSTPTEGDRLESSPKEVRLWFNEPPELPFTSITLLAADSSKVLVSKAATTPDSLAVTFTVGAALPPGTYSVNWRTASADGHAARGRFGFSVTK